VDAFSVQQDRKEKWRSVQHDNAPDQAGCPALVSDI